MKCKGKGEVRDMEYNKKRRDNGGRRSLEETEKALLAPCCRLGVLAQIHEALQLLHDIF